MDKKFKIRVLKAKRITFLRMCRQCMSKNVRKLTRYISIGNAGHLF